MKIKDKPDVKSNKKHKQDTKHDIKINKEHKQDVKPNIELKQDVKKPDTNKIIYEDEKVALVFGNNICLYSMVDFQMTSAFG